MDRWVSSETLAPLFLVKFIFSGYDVSVCCTAWLSDEKANQCLLHPFFMWDCVAYFVAGWVVSFFEVMTPLRIHIIPKILFYLLPVSLLAVWDFYQTYGVRALSIHHKLHSGLVDFLHLAHSNCFLNDDDIRLLSIPVVSLSFVDHNLVSC